MCESCRHSPSCQLRNRSPYYCTTTLGLVPAKMHSENYAHGFGTGQHDVCLTDRPKAMAVLSLFIRIIFNPGEQPPPIRRDDQVVMYKKNGVCLCIREDLHPSSIVGPLKGSFDVKLKRDGRGISFHFAYKKD